MCYEVNYRNITSFKYIFYVIKKNLNSLDNLEQNSNFEMYKSENCKEL